MAAGAAPVKAGDGKGFGVGGGSNEAPGVVDDGKVKPPDMKLALNFESELGGIHSLSGVWPSEVVGPPKVGALIVIDLGAALSKTTAPPAEVLTVANILVVVTLVTFKPETAPRLSSSESCQIDTLKKKC